MERSLAGEALPRDSEEMKAIVAYINFLGTGLQSGYTFKQMPGQEFRAVPLQTSAADPVRGKEIYKDRCSGCHEDDGQGRWNEKELRYGIPAIWGTTASA